MKEFTDTERLEFLLTGELFVVEIFGRWYVKEVGWYGENNTITYGNTPREAIDDAMKALSA